MPKDLFEGKGPSKGKDLFGGKKPGTEAPLSEFFGSPSSPSSPQEPSVKNSPQWGRIARDIGGGIADIPGALFHALTNIPSIVSEASNVPGMGASRIAENTFYGLAKGGQGLLNTPSNIANYLANRGIIEQGTAAKFPRLEDPAFESSEWLLGKPQKGDVLLQKIAEIAPNLIARNPAAIAGLHAIGQNENPITAAGSVKGGELLGKVIPKTARFAHRAVKGYPELGEEIVSAAQQTQKTASQMFEDVLAPIDKNIKLPKVDKNVLKHADASFLKELLKKGNASAKELNEASSNVGSLIGDLNLSDLKRGLSPDEKLLMKNAIKAKQDLDQALFNAVEKQGGPGLVEKFKEARNFYKENYIPYKENKKLISEFKAGRLTNDEFLDALQKETEFMNLRGKEYHPGLESRKAQQVLEQKTLIKWLKDMLKNIDKV